MEIDRTGFLVAPEIRYRFVYRSLLSVFLGTSPQYLFVNEEFTRNRESEIRGMGYPSIPDNHASVGGLFGGVGIELKLPLVFRLGASLYPGVYVASDWHGQPAFMPSMQTRVYVGGAF